MGRQIGRNRGISNSSLLHPGRILNFGQMKVERALTSAVMALLAECSTAFQIAERRLEAEGLKQKLHRHQRSPLNLKGWSFDFGV